MRQFLIIDADDTLWENNIYFERAFDEFAEFLNHSSMPPAEVRDVLDEIEAANARIHGYGSLNFARNLRECYEHLAEREVSEDDLKTVMGFAEQILRCPMEVIEGVAETLEYLSSRHDLTLFTKGHIEEEAQNRSLRPGKVLRPHRHREGEGRRRVPQAGGGAWHGPGPNLDDREQSEVRHQPGAGGGAERRLRPARPHVDSGEAGDRSRPWPPADPGAV
jgi:hypothetical protein